MFNLKKVIVAITVLIIILSAAAYAASSSSYMVSPEGFGMSPGSSESSSFKAWSTTGDMAIGKATSSSYDMGAGFVSAYLQESSDVSSPEAPDTQKPVIENIKFDGKTLVSGDYVKASPTITATITDETPAVVAANSSLEVDSVYIKLSELPGDSTYSAVTGALTYKPTFTTDGDHTFRIHARDTAGNYASSEVISFKVESTTANITGTVLNYPNPFNPATGQETEIEYQLTRDAAVVIYIFNTVGQLIKKIDCASGFTGGSAGYNKVAWNGYSDFAEIAGNDIYLVRIVSGGSVIGRTKIAVLK